MTHERMHGRQNERSLQDGCCVLTVKQDFLIQTVNENLARFMKHWIEFFR
jgi:hypothetical protein